MPELTIAVPRGALLGETLDLLDTLGIDTAEVRANDRKLLFPDSGIVTMRPSDVPTYVEYGAADIGISLPGTGEQPRAPVYVDGEKVRTLEGPTLADDFIAMVEEHVEARFPLASATAAG